MTQEIRGLNEAHNPIFIKMRSQIEDALKCVLQHLGYNTDARTYTAESLDEIAKKEGLEVVQGYAGEEIFTHIRVKGKTVWSMTLHTPSIDIRQVRVTLGLRVWCDPDWT